jgi:paired amphipathic helix protein Sin3a
LTEFLQFLPVNAREPPVTQKKEKKKVGPKPAIQRESTSTSNSKRTSARKAEENIKKHSQDSNPSNNNSSLEGPATASLFENIKKQLNSEEVYQEFLKLVNMYSNGVIGKQELIKLVSEIIGDHTELVKAFKKLVSTSSSSFGNFFCLIIFNRRKV